MNIGMVGTGSIAHTMAKEFARPTTMPVVAVYSRNADTRAAMANEFHIPKVYTEYNEMLADPEVELIYIATPNSLHFEQAKAALLAGKHVLCEKPIVPTLAQLDELLGLAEERHLHLLEAITTIDHPNYGLAKLFAKEIGDIKTVSCTFCQYSSRYDAFMNGQTPPVFDPAYCGGALMDLNIYNIYFVVGLFGDPKAVHYYPNRHANGIDTSGILILEYPDFVCQCTAAKDSSAHNSAQIIGTEGSILIEPGSNNCQKLVVTRKGKEPYISEISDTPWWFEVLGISNFLIVPQDAVKERRIRAMRSAVVRYIYYLENDQKQLVENTYTQVRPERSFTLLEDVDCPAVLAEQCFVTNAEDVERFGSEEGCKKPQNKSFHFCRGCTFFERNNCKISAYHRAKKKPSAAA